MAGATQRANDCDPTANERKGNREVPSKILVAAIIFFVNKTHCWSTHRKPGLRKMNKESSFCTLLQEAENIQADLQMAKQSKVFIEK